MSEDNATHAVVRNGGDGPSVQAAKLVTKADVVLFRGNLKECRTFVNRFGSRLEKPEE